MGADGHMAVERAHGTHCHDGTADATHRDHTGADAVTAAHGVVVTSCRDACVDVRLSLEGRVHRVSDAKRIAPVSPVVMARPSAPASSIMPASADAGRLHTHGPPRITPFPASLRTVILRT